MAKSKSATLAERTAALQRDLAGAQATVQRQAADIQSLAAAKSALDATLASERRNAAEKLRLLSEASEELKSQFKALAASALENNNTNFLQLANSVLRNYQTQAEGDLAQKEQAVKNLVDPITQSLAGMNQQIQSLEQARSQAYGTLTSQVASLLVTQKALQTETGNLVKALRDEGHFVRACDIKVQEDWWQVHQGVQNAFHLDLTSPANARYATAGMDYVYDLAEHMGGIYFIEHNKVSCAESIEIGIALLRASIRNDVTRFFFASSACVYPTHRQKSYGTSMGTISPAIALKEDDAWPALP